MKPVGQGGPVQLLASILFTTFLFAWTAVYGVFFVIVAPFRDMRGRAALAAFWARAILAVLKATCRLDYTVEGLERLPPGANVSLWKHSSAWETIAMMAIMPPQTWVLKHELTWIPIVGWGIRLMKAIAIDRRSGGSAVNQVLDQGIDRLKRGLWVVVFPEGTRVPIGQTRKYGVSGALLASRTGCLVVPVAHDAGRYWARRGWLKRPGVIRVIIGEPIVARDRDPREINAEAQAWIEDTIAKLG